MSGNVLDSYLESIGCLCGVKNLNAGCAIDAMYGGDKPKPFRKKAVPVSFSVSNTHAARSRISAWVGSTFIGFVEKQEL